MKPFDVCVLTAANKVQAEGYRQQIEWRRKHRQLQEQTEFRIIEDPLGKRIGSGGSTLYVLSKLLANGRGHLQKNFLNKRILIIHSGGDSRRLPSYSPCGKIFVPMPTPDHQTLFDIMIDTYRSLPHLPNGQVIITSGDVLLNFDAGQLFFSQTGMTGVAYPDDYHVATGHGVYIPITQSHGRAVKVRNFLQKPTCAVLQQTQALDYSQRAWVDTGIVNLALDAVEELMQCKKLLSEIARGRLELNLYHELFFTVLGKHTLEDENIIQRIPFFVSLLPYCGFFHIGRSREFLHNLYTLTHASTLYRFDHFCRSNAKVAPQLKNVFCYNSLITSKNIHTSSPSLIENSHIKNQLYLAGENIITGLNSDHTAISLSKGLCLSIWPIHGNRYAAMIYGIEDHFKSGVDIKNNFFMNQPFDEWMKDRNLSSDHFWRQGENEDLWTGRFFPVAKHSDGAVKLALLLQDRQAELNDYLQSERISFQELLNKVDHEAYLAQKDIIFRAILRSDLEHISNLPSGWNTEQLIDLCETETDLDLLASALKRMANGTSDHLIRARLIYLRSRVLAHYANNFTQKKMQLFIRESEKNMDQAFAEIRETVAQSSSKHEQIEHQGLAIRSDEVVWVCSPARLDFAGGWSDTPPYCLEHGGTVLNAAVTLNGQYPIQAIGKILQEPIIRINSIDLGASEVIKDIDSLLAFVDPTNWLSLPKASLVAAGIFSGEERIDLEARLTQFGGGIDLTLFSALPAGSGLGTSSILGAAVIACIVRMFGLTFSQNELFQRTSHLEQLMTTGGGWQDQIGGVTGGIKLIQTQPGLTQNPSLSWTQLFSPDQHHAPDYLLYYTGYRRIAKNILRQVVGRFLNHDAEALATVIRLKQLAVEMKNLLDCRKYDAFGECIAEVWGCNKRLDQGSSTEAIESILHLIERHIHGAKLLGAGGGGFLFIVAKGPRDSQKIRHLLQQNPPNERARFFDFDVDAGGLKVNVL